MFLAALVTAALFGSAVPAALAQSAAQVTIAIDDVVVTEGDSGTVDAVFTVSLSRSSSQPVTVQYTTVNGSVFDAPPGLEVSDYLAAFGTLTIAPGDTIGVIRVSVRGDVIYEPNETFFVNLSNPTNATLADDQGQATLADDPVPAIVISNEIAVEGNVATFTVSLSNPSSASVMVEFATANGTPLQSCVRRRASAWGITTAPLERWSSATGRRSKPSVFRWLTIGSMTHLSSSSSTSPARPTRRSRMAKAWARSSTTHSSAYSG